MRKISDNYLLEHYIAKHNIEDILSAEILKHGQLHLYEKDECIYAADSQLEYYYLLVDGKIKISYLFENGKSMLLKFYKDFNSIGDLELLKNLPIRCNIDAADNTYLIGISSELLRNNYLNDVKFLHHLIDSLSEKLYATINNSSYNFVYPVTNRFASFLAAHLNDKSYVTLTSSYTEIAEFLGTTYRHLSRTIKELEEQEIIKGDNKTIYILDEEKLKELSKNLYIESL